MAELLRIQRTCGGGWWIPSKNLVTSVSHHMSQGTYYQAIVVGKFGVNMRVLHPYFPVPHSKYLDLSECFSFW